MDGIVIISTFVMLYGYTIFAQLVAFLSTFLDATVLFLIVKTIANCTNIYQTGTCYNTIVVDIIILALVCIFTIIDVFQFFSMNALRKKLSEEMSPRSEYETLQKRARLLHLWSMPFQFGIALSDLTSNYEDSLYSLVAIPIILTPILVYTSMLYETQTLSFIFTIAIVVSDMVNAVYSKSDYATWCIYTLLVFDTCLVGIRLFLSVNNMNPKDKND